MKLILGIIAFTLTFGLSTTLVGLVFGFPKTVSSPHIKLRTTSHVTARKIKSLLIRDDRIGNYRSRQILRYQKNSGLGETEIFGSLVYSQSVSFYVSKASGINDAGLPRDFQYAWRNHMKAWRAKAGYLESRKTLSDYESIFSAEYKNNDKQIQRTWYQVLRIAERYGVNTDRFPR